MRTRSLLRPRVGAVLALVDPALGGRVEGVHDLRVAARSLRAALRTLARRPDSISVRKTRRALRTAICALADVRDRDVGRSLLGKLPAGHADEAALKRRILGLSDSDRRVALTRAVASWPRTLDRLFINLLDLGEPAVRSVIRRTRAEAWQQRGRALNVIGSLGRRYDPVRLHELRRRIRSLRYAVEVLAEVDSSAHARVILLKPLQSALGDAQDRIVLSRWLMKHAERFGASDISLASALRKEAERFRAQSVRSHAKFLKLRPRDALNRLALHVDPAYAPPAIRPRRRSS